MSSPKETFVSDEDRFAALQESLETVWSSGGPIMERYDDKFSSHSGQPFVEEALIENSTIFTNQVEDLVKDAHFFVNIIIRNQAIWNGFLSGHPLSLCADVQALLGFICRSLSLVVQSIPRFAQFFLNVSDTFSDVFVRQVYALNQAFSVQLRNYLTTDQQVIIPNVPLFSLRVKFLILRSQMTSLLSLRNVFYGSPAFSVGILQEFNLFE